MPAMNRRPTESAAMTRAVAGRARRPAVYRGLMPPELQVIELDRRGTPEQRHLHLHLPLVGEDLLDRPREVRERTLGDLHRLPHEEGDLFLALRRGHLFGDAQQS